MPWYFDHKIVGTVGLSCDIVGALLVAVEVVKVFRGTQTIDLNTAKKAEDPRLKEVLAFGTIPPHVPNPEFAKHEKEKITYMKVGLGFLLLGFLLQVVALWL